MVDFLPSPAESEVIDGFDLTGEAQQRKISDSEDLSALAFKIVADKHVGKLIYVRVYSGAIKSGSYVLNSSINKQQRVGRIFRIHANHQEIVESLNCGEIGALVGLPDTVTGNTLSSVENPIVLEQIHFPEPVISIAVSPQKNADREKLMLSLARLAEEDPTFTVKTDPETENTIISGMGELHLEVLLDRLKREFSVNVDSGAPEVAYRETISRAVDFEERYRKQTGGHGQYAHIIFRLEPLEPGKGWEFVNEVKGGNIPREYIPAIEKGIEDAMLKGPMGAYPCVDFRFVLLDGSHHEVDSSEMAFRICASTAFKAAFAIAGPQLLEPVMKLTISTPEEYSGAITGNLCSRRGRVLGMETLASGQFIHAVAPLASLFGYTSDLRNLSQGRASFNMQFEHCEQVPKNIAEKLLEERQKK